MTEIIQHLELSHETDIYYPFALEELLCRRIGELAVTAPVMHIWRHDRAFVLGLRDSRLPYAAEAMEWLTREGYRVMVRNSGGAAVPLDRGVFNVTLIRKSERGSLGMYEDFRMMADLLQQSLLPLGVRFETGEIEGSYCPGEYDLSIHGRKFCGIAQRRQLQAYAVQAFVNVEGDSLSRAKLVREFYTRAGGGRSVAGVLDINTSVLGNISELHPGFPGADAWLTQLQQTAASFGSVSEAAISDFQSIYEEAQAGIQAMIHQMKKRYDPRTFSIYP